MDTAGEAHLTTPNSQQASYASNPIETATAGTARNAARHSCQNPASMQMLVLKQVLVLGLLDCWKFQHPPLRCWSTPAW